MTGTQNSAAISTDAFADEFKVAECCRALWSNRDQHKYDMEMRWLRNIEFAYGNQWWTWNPDKRCMEPDPKRPDYDIRLAYNRIGFTIEARTSRLLRRDPVWTCPPETDDDSDSVVAKTSNSVLGYYYTEALKMPDCLRKVLSWAQVVGDVWLRVSWNPFKGTDIVTAFDDFMRPQQPEMDPATISQMQAEDQSQFSQMFGKDALQAGQATQKSGEVEVEIITPFQMIRWPYDIIEDSEAAIRMVTRRKSHAQVAKEYGLDIDEVRAMARGSDADEDYRARLAQTMGGAESSNADGNNSETILEHELIVEAGKGGWQNGRMAVVLGYSPKAQKLGDINTPGHRSPYFHLQEKPIPGKLWSTSTVDQMLAGQIDLNLAASQESNWSNRCIYPTIVRIAGDLVDDSTFSNAPGKVMEVASRDHIPVVLERPQLGNEHARRIERNIAMLNDIGGVSAVDLGSAEGDNVKSGRAIIALQDQNDQRLKLFADAIDDWMSDVGSMVLDLLRANVTDERVAHIIGDNNRGEIRKWKATDLHPTNYKPNGNPAAVKVSSFKNLPTTKSEMYNFVTQFAKPAEQGGLFDPIKDRSVLLRMLGVGNANEAFDPFREDESNADSEQELWRNGKEAPEPSIADDHETHIRMHRKYIKSDQFKRTDATNPMLANSIVMHWQKHMELLMVEQARIPYLQKLADLTAYQEIAGQAAREFGPQIATTFFPAPMSAEAPPELTIQQQHGPSAKPQKPQKTGQQP